MVAVSSASPSRCFLFWPGRRARIASLIVLATVAIPPTTQPHPLPIRPHAPRRRLGCAAQETMGGEGLLPVDSTGPITEAQDERLQAAAPCPAADRPDRLRRRHQDRKVNGIEVSGASGKMCAITAAFDREAADDDQGPYAQRRGAGRADAGGA